MTNENGKQDQGSVYRVFRTAFAAAFEIRLDAAAPLFDAENEPNDELERVRRGVERWSVEERRDFSTFRDRKAAFVDAAATLAEYLRDVGVDLETVEDESARFGWEALTAAGGSASETLFLGRLETAALEFGRAFSFLTNEERTAARLAAGLAQAFLTESANAAATLRRIDAETFDASAPKSSFGAFWRLRTDARDALAALAGRPTTKEIWRSLGRRFWERAAAEPDEETALRAFRLARAARAAENDDWTRAFETIKRVENGDDEELNDAVKTLFEATCGPIARLETSTVRAETPALTLEEAPPIERTFDGTEDAENEKTSENEKIEEKKTAEEGAPARRTSEAGARRVVKVKGGVEIALRWIPAGEFELGSPADEPGRSVDEALHKATLTRGVWIAETETTQRLWASVMGTNPSWFSATGGGKAEVAGLETDDFPVENVSWNDCREFFAKLNAFGSAPGWRFRLPTEAEWERACRAGTTTRFYWGDDWRDDEASVGSETSARTRRVGKGEPNPWGLFDMSGNVAEWCEDYYCVDFHVENAVDPTGPSVGGKAGARVVRGGAFDRAEDDLRSARRFPCGPTTRRKDVGFRLALAKEASGETARPEEASRPEEAAPVKRETVAAAGGETSAKSENSTAKKKTVPKPTIGPNAGKRTTRAVKKAGELAFRYCPPGTFWMGSPTDEPGRNAERETLRKVTLTKGFWMLETPVTQKIWKAATGTNPSWFSATGGGKAEVKGVATDDFPVENVSWNDVQTFLQKANAAKWGQKGWKLRLPTEAEWEWACRAGTTTAYFWGDDWQVGKANGAGASTRTRKVEEGEANAWGIRDMCGNVAEWCSDRYGALATNDATDPTGAKTGDARVLRGGSWRASATALRSAARCSNTTGVRANWIGFRLVLAKVK